MNRLKLIFSQTLMIASAILFGLGIEEAVDRVVTGDVYMRWEWYIPLSIILCAFICSVPSVIFSDDRTSGRKFTVKVGIHFICIFTAVSLFGLLFGWYTDLAGFIVIAVMIVIIYVFTWVATYWLLKSDENKINDALKDVRDEE